MQVFLSRRRLELIEEGLALLETRRYENYMKFGSSARPALDEVTGLRTLVLERLKPLPELEDMEL